MDRVEFLHSINCPEGTTGLDIIISFFDQYMLLYNMVDNVSQASLVHFVDNLIIFQMICDSKKSAIDMYNKILANPSILIYESIYNVHADIVDDFTINISISK